MVQIILLVMVLAALAAMRRKQQPSVGDVGWLLPAVRMSTALLLAGLIGWAVWELF